MLVTCGFVGAACGNRTHDLRITRTPTPPPPLATCGSTATSLSGRRPDCLVGRQFASQAVSRQHARPHRPSVGEAARAALGCPVRRGSSYCGLVDVAPIQASVATQDLTTELAGLRTLVEQLRVENARLLRLLRLSPQEAGVPGPVQSGWFESAPGPVHARS